MGQVSVPDRVAKGAFSKPHPKGLRQFRVPEWAVNETSNERSALETVMPLDHVFSPASGKKLSAVSAKSLTPFSPYNAFLSSLSLNVP